MAKINTKRILGATAVLLIIALIALIAKASDLSKTINEQEYEIELLRTEIGILDEQLSVTHDTGEMQHSEDITQTASMLELHGDDMIISRDLPNEVALLLETLVTSLSTSDEELYRSLFKTAALADGDSAEYLMSVFHRYNGTQYVVRRISASVGDGTPGYATVVAEGENGEYFYHQGVGVAKDKQTGKWVIFDFD